MNVLHLKFILVGDTSVGKTSLFRRYTEDKFDEIYEPTIGIGSKIKEITIKGYKINSHIFDTAGQERFKSLIKNYFRNNNGIFIAFDLTNKKSFENIKYWIDEIKSSQIDNNIIILGNKSDLNEIIQVTDEDIKEFEKNNDIQIIKTSAKNNINIEQAFEAMFDLVIRNKNEEEIYSEFCPNYNKKKLMENNQINNSIVRCCA